MVTIIRDIFINIFQTEHISAVKFDMGYEKKIWAFLWSRISKSLKKKLKKSDWAPLTSFISFHFNVYFATLRTTWPPDPPVSVSNISMFGITSLGLVTGHYTFVNCGHLKKNLLLPDLKIW